MDALAAATSDPSLEDLTDVGIGTLDALASHTRFHLTLRATVGDGSGSGTMATAYLRLLLFRLAAARNARPELYCMEATCPHLGAPLSHAPFQEGDGLEVASKDDEELQHDKAIGTESTPAIDLDREMRDMEDVLGYAGDAHLEHGSAAHAGPRPGRTIVCPWHKYDFDLRDGSSGTGMSVCVYRVRVRGRGEGAGRDVWVEKPVLEGRRGEEGGGQSGQGEGGGPTWEVVELRGVSEEFADPPVVPALSTVPPASSCASAAVPSACPSLSTSVPPPSVLIPALPPTLTAAALLILQTPSPSTKLALTRAAAHALRTGGFRAIRPTRGDEKAARGLFGVGAYEAADDGAAGGDGGGGEGGGKAWIPPREGVESVQPDAVKKRGKGGNEKSRILMLHALANIEQWAIDLAWDIIARFGHTTVNGAPLPVEFFLDFARMAEDEAKHFSLLAKRLRELGSYYGAHSVHASLWESAIETSHSLSSRLAIIHLVAEARGLDVNPLTIEKFRKAGDAESVRVLDIIHGDEVTHVTTGHRWFTWLCQQKGVDPIATFRQEVKDHFRGKLKGPFNDEDRAKAGMSRDYYEDLEGGGWTVKPRPGKAAEGDERIHPRLT